MSFLPLLILLLPLVSLHPTYLLSNLSFEFLCLFGCIVEKCATRQAPFQPKAIKPGLDDCDRYRVFVDEPNQGSYPSAESKDEDRYDYGEGNGNCFC